MMQYPLRTGNFSKEGSNRLAQHTKVSDWPAFDGKLSFIGTAEEETPVTGTTPRVGRITEGTATGEVMIDFMDEVTSRR